MRKELRDLKTKMEKRTWEKPGKDMTR